MTCICVNHTTISAELDLLIVNPVPFSNHLRSQLSEWHLGCLIPRFLSIPDLFLQSESERNQKRLPSRARIKFLHLRG